MTTVNLGNGEIRTKDLILPPPREDSIKLRNAELIACEGRLYFIRSCKYIDRSNKTEAYMLRSYKYIDGRNKIQAYMLDATHFDWLALPDIPYSQGCVHSHAVIYNGDVVAIGSMSERTYVERRYNGFELNDVFRCRISRKDYEWLPLPSISKVDPRWTHITNHGSTSVVVEDRICAFAARSSGIVAAELEFGRRWTIWTTLPLPPVPLPLSHLLTTLRYLLPYLPVESPLSCFIDRRPSWRRAL
jgi:hypothetical protein